MFDHYSIPESASFNARGPQKIRLFEGWDREDFFGQMSWKCKCMDCSSVMAIFQHLRKSRGPLPSLILEIHLLEKVNSNYVLGSPKMLADFLSSHEYLYWLTMHSLFSKGLVKIQTRLCLPFSSTEGLHVPLLSSILFLRIRPCRSAKTSACNFCRF